MINYLYVTDFEKSSQVDGAKCDAKGHPQHLHSFCITFDPTNPYKYEYKFDG